MAPGEALPLLADGTIDPRADGAAGDGAPRAERPGRSGGRGGASLEPTSRTGWSCRSPPQAPALLVLSEVWDPGWSATVSGVPTPVLLANHALRAAAHPAGQHTGRALL